MSNKLSPTTSISENTKESQEKSNLINYISVVWLTVATAIWAPTTTHADSITDLRLAWDIGQFVAPAIAAACASKKWALGNYVVEYTTAVWASHLSKAILWNKGIWERPNGKDTAGFPSSHTTSAASGFVWSLKYCDDPYSKFVAGVATWITAYSRFAKDKNWSAPHTPLQVGAGVVLPFVFEFTGINDSVSNWVAKALWIPEDHVQFKVGDGLDENGGINIFRGEIKF